LGLGNGEQGIRRLARGREGAEEAGDGASVFGHVMSAEYQQYLESPHWMTLRHLKRLKARQCGICGSADRLHVHHLNYRHLVDVELSDLRVMCKRCHFLCHELHRAGKFTFTSTNHHHRWAILKSAVKKHLGIRTRNMFR
jgi:hypothetical protein